jgi:hypothetical protein
LTSKSLSWIAAAIGFRTHATFAFDPDYGNLRAMFTKNRPTLINAGKTTTLRPIVPREAIAVHLPEMAAFGHGLHAVPMHFASTNPLNC